MTHLLHFYGDGCKHCAKLEPIIQTVEKELGIKIERIEVWNDWDNFDIMRGLNKECCPSVPFFFNKKTGRSICGMTTHEKLREWAEGK